MERRIALSPTDIFQTMSSQCHSRLGTKIPATIFFPQDILEVAREVTKSCLGGSFFAEICSGELKYALFLEVWKEGSCNFEMSFDKKT